MIAGWLRRPPLVLAVGAAVVAGVATWTTLEADAQVRGPQSVAPVAEKLIDAVVNISTTQTVKGQQGAPLPRVPKGSPFEEFFEEYFRKGGGQPRQDRKSSSLGSGFVIDGKEGLIVTNHHVIEGADEITVNFHDGSKLKVERVLGRDNKTDLALLKVAPKKPLTAVKFGSADAVKVGDWVIAIGNPFGLGGSVTVGIISAKARNINSGPYDDYLQTDAAINKGNSGGPLFSMNGEVIGVNTAIISPTGGSIGIGFAVPADTAMNVIDQLKQFGEVRRGWLGVRIQSVGEEIASSLGVPENTGALVSSVVKEGPAAKGGVEAGDVILKFDGKEISSMRGLPRVVAQTPVGKSVDVELLRNGQKKSVKVVVGRLNEDDAGTADSTSEGVAAPAERRLIGLKLAPLTDELRKKYGLAQRVQGVVITEVEPQSPAAERNLQPGDVIIEAADEAVSSVEDILGRIDGVRKTGRRQILLRVENAKGEFRSVALPFQ
jgi:serine protease Do